jgi:hypothetical protein
MLLPVCNRWQEKGNLKGSARIMKGAAFRNKIFVVRRSETEGDSQKDD